MIQGAPKFSGLAVGEITVNKMGPTLKMEAKAAFVDPKTGSTHGWTTGNQWSPTTVVKLGELLALMEEDMARIHFDGGGTTSDSPITPVRQVPGVSGGLGEHVAGRDGDQV